MAAAVFSIAVHIIKIVPRGFPATAAAAAATVFTGCPGSQSNAFDNPSPLVNPITLLSPEKSVTATLHRTHTRKGTFQHLLPSFSLLTLCRFLSHSLSLSLSLSIPLYTTFTGVYSAIVNYHYRYH